MHRPHGLPRPAGFTAMSLKAGAMLAACLVLMGCGVLRTNGPAPQGVDFSGHWQLNREQSDSTEKLLETLAEKGDFRFRKNPPRASGAIIVPPRGANSRAPGGPVDEHFGPPRSKELEALLRQPEDFTLVQSLRDLTMKSTDGTRQYGFGEDSVVSLYDGIGDQHCGWTGNQFSVDIRAVDGRRITHLITLSRDRAQLLLTTSVSGGGLPSLRFNRTYDRAG